MEFSLFGIIGVAAISVICYLVGMMGKVAPLEDKYIPVVCGLSGAILGVVGFFVMPDYPANDIITAIAVGIVSGLAATGANQIYKQFTKAEE